MKQLIILEAINNRIKSERVYLQKERSGINVRKVLWLNVQKNTSINVKNICLFAQYHPASATSNEVKTTHRKS